MSGQDVWSALARCALDSNVVAVHLSHSPLNPQRGQKSLMRLAFFLPSRKDSASSFLCIFSTGCLSFIRTPSCRYVLDITATPAHRVMACLLVLMSFDPAYYSFNRLHLISAFPGVTWIIELFPSSSLPMCGG